MSTPVTEEVRVVRRPRPPRARPGPSGAALARAGALAAIVASVVVVFGPGVMTLDTLTICDQAWTGEPTDWHTAVFAAAWGATRLPPAWLFILQTTALVGAVFGVLRLWLGGWAAVAWTALVAWFPASAGWFGGVGKDQWFAAGALAAVAALGHARRTAGGTRWALAAAGVSALWVAVAARPNGIVPVACLLLVAWPSVGGGRPPLVRWAVHLAAVGGICLGILLTQSALESWVIRPEVTRPQQVTLQNDLAGMSVRTGEVLLPSSSLRPGATLADIDEYFSYERPTDLYWLPDSPLVMGAGTYGDLRAAWTEAVREHPGAYLAHRARMAAGILGVTGPHPLGTAVDGGGRGEDFGLTCPLPDPFAPAARDGVQSLLIRIERANLWRAWSWLVLLVAAGAVAGFRRNPEARALVAVGAVSLVSIAAAAGSLTFRYAWVTVVCALVATGLALARGAEWHRQRRERSSVRSGDGHDGVDAAAEAGDPDPVLQRGGDPAGHPVGPAP
jgi:hypothetical protein